MMKFMRIAVLAWLTGATLAGAAEPTPEQQEVTAFIQKMYSYSANTFEWGYFKGNYEPDRQCALMEEFFLKNILKRPEKDQGCKVAPRAYIRYPGAFSEDLSENRSSGQMPKPKLSIPIVDGGSATISAETKKFGKTIYFLAKTDKGWRVENALYFERIPDEGNVCRGEFVKEPPTRSQQKYRPACKDY